MSACPAGALTCATARPPSRCICSGGCCVATQPSSSARLFVALDLPDEARAELVDWRERALGGREGLRLVDPAGRHVTLAFFGHRPESEIERIAETVRGAVRPGTPPCLAAKGIKAVP